MPELPEAEVILQQLRSRILGSTIRTIWIGRQDIVRNGFPQIPWLRNVQITEIVRRGKCLVLTCMNGKQERRYLVAELGMTGLLLFPGLDQRYDKHTHMMLLLEGGKEQELRYWNPRRFGRLSVLTLHEFEQFVCRRFGPDPLSMTEHDFIPLIKHGRGRIKALLLNQHKISGIGNIYANEILHWAGIHPYAHGNTLSKKRIAGLFAATQQILQKAIQYGGSTIRDFRAPDGRPGQYQHHHRVYQKTGKSCSKGCPTPIQRLVTEPSSFYCPTCQQ